MKIGILNECFFNKDTIKRLKQLGEVEIKLDTDTKEKVMAYLKRKTYNTCTNCDGLILDGILG